MVSRRRLCIVVRTLPVLLEFFLTLHRPCYPVLPFFYYCWSHWLVHLVNSCDLLISLGFYKSIVSGDDIWQWVRMQYIGAVTWYQIRLTVWIRFWRLESLQQVQDGNIMFIHAILRVLLSIRHDQAWPQKFVTWYIHGIFLGESTKLRKAIICFPMSACLSVCPHETTRLPLDGFLLNLIQVCAA